MQMYELLFISQAIHPSFLLFMIKISDNEKQISEHSSVFTNIYEQPFAIIASHINPHYIYK